MFSCESGEASFDSNVLKYRVSFSEIKKLKIKLYIYYWNKTNINFNDFYVINIYYKYFLFLFIRKKFIQIACTLPTYISSFKMLWRSTIPYHCWSLQEKETSMILQNVVLIWILRMFFRILDCWNSWWTCTWTSIQQNSLISAQEK